MAASIASDVIAQFKRFHVFPLAAAEEKARNLASLNAMPDSTPEQVKALADDFVASYKTERARHEVAMAAQAKKERTDLLVKELSGTPLNDIEGPQTTLLIEAIGLGLNPRVAVEKNEDGQDILVLGMTPLAGGSASGGARAPLVVTERTRKSFTFFHNGERLSIPLSRHILENYPNSVAGTYLASYKTKANKSKLGAWQAVERDDDLKKVYTREEKVETVA